MERIVNAVGFQAGWWACVGGAGLGLDLPALALGGTLAGAHLLRSAAPRDEALLAARLLVMGVAIDSALQWAGVISFHGIAPGHLSPLWLWMLWILFALTLRSSLGFLRARPLALSAVLGGVFGPVSYLAGAQLGAASFEGRPWQVAALAAAWMLAMPAAVALARQAPASPQ